MKKYGSLLVIVGLMLSMFVVPAFAHNSNTSTGHPPPDKGYTASWPKEGYRKKQGKQDVNPEHARVGSSASWVMVGSKDVEDFFREYPTLLEEAKGNFTLRIINKSGISQSGVAALDKIAKKEKLNINIQWSIVENKETVARVTVALADLPLGKENYQTMANYEVLNETQNRFTNRFSQDIKVVGIGGTGYRVPAQVSVKLPENISEEDLYVYTYNHSLKTYTPLQSPVSVDANGNVHFTTDLKYDVLLSNGPLVK